MYTYKILCVYWLWNHVIQVVVGLCWNFLKEAHFENVLLLKLIVWFRYCLSQVLYLKLVLKTCMGKNFCTVSNSSIVYIDFLRSIHSPLKFESVIVFGICQKDIFQEKWNLLGRIFFLKLRCLYLNWIWMDV